MEEDTTQFRTRLLTENNELFNLYFVGFFASYAHVNVIELVLVTA